MPLLNTPCHPCFQRHIGLVCVECKLNTQGLWKSRSLKKGDQKKEFEILNKCLKIQNKPLKIQTFKRTFESSNKNVKWKRQICKSESSKSFWRFKRMFENSTRAFESLNAQKSVWKSKSHFELSIVQKYERNFKRKWSRTFSQFYISSTIQIALNKMTLITTVSIAKYLSNHMYMPFISNIYLFKMYPNRIAF